MELMVLMEKMKLHECWKSSSVGYSGIIIMRFDLHMLGPLSLELENSFIYYMLGQLFIGFQLVIHIPAGVG